MIKEQLSFEGGMNLLVDDTQIPDNAYKALINGRQRLGYIEPTLSNVLIENLPAGKKQCIIGIGNVLVIFIAGRAYYNIDGSSAWINIAGFLMSTTADVLWAVDVPASTFNYVRSLNPTGNVSDPIINSLDFTINGVPAAILVQDNINQPWVIFFDTATQTFTSRVTQNYSQWTITNQEYVPVGQQMFTLNGKTFIVARDGKSLMHSVSGRPLNFMVAIDVNGDKLPSESKGGATTTAFSFDSEIITCVRSINIPDSFIYATIHVVRILTLNYTTTIFGEPRVHESANIEAGIVNQESMCELLGEYAFVDYDTVKRFDAVQQLKYSGKNSIFSLMLSSLLKNIKQIEPACTVFDNFGMFYLKTIWGNAIAVYDTLREQWISLDITTADRIRQFAQTSNQTQFKLWCITRMNELYQLYGSETSEMAELFTKSYAPEDSRNEHKTASLILTYQSATAEGEATVIEYVDNMQGQRLTHTLLETRAGINFPIQFPIIFDNKNQGDGLTYVLQEGQVGKKLGYVVRWNTDARLMGYKLTTSEKSSDSSLKQSAAVYTT